MVTGAAHGIGAEVASRLVQDGWRVVAVDNDADRLAEGVAALGSSPRAEVADLTDPESVARALAGLDEAEGRLDGLVSNAGIMIRKPIAPLAPEEWARVIATNLTATFLLVRAGERLLPAAKGKVVTMASTCTHMSSRTPKPMPQARAGCWR